MKRDVFFEKLKEVTGIVDDVLKDHGVISDTALYGFLQTASVSLRLSQSHIGEYDEAFAELISNLPNHNQA